MNTVIFYPYLFPSLEWLKMAAKGWDKIYLLGTSLIGRVNAPEEIARFDLALGRIVDFSLHVEDYMDEETAYKFKQWVLLHEESIKQDGVSSERQPLFGLYDSKLNFEEQRRLNTEIDLLDWLKERNLVKVVYPERAEYNVNYI